MLNKLLCVKSLEYIALLGKLWFPSYPRQENHRDDMISRCHSWVREKDLLITGR